MDYQYLESSQQRAQLESRLRDLESQHFSATVSRLTFEASGDAEQLKAQDAQLAKIDDEYGLVEQKLAALLREEEQGLKNQPPAAPGAEEERLGAV